ncbi:hypothetical protein MASR2M78_22140 [Treponema sp.]
MLDTLKRAQPRLQAAFLLFSGILFSGTAFKAFSYDTRFFIGSRLGSEDYHTIGSLSWDYASMRVLDAFRSAVDVKASSDVVGSVSLDAFASFEASHSAGNLIPGLRLESTANYHEIDGSYGDIESLILDASLPLNINGASVSYSLRPFIGAGFFDDEEWNTGAEFFAAFLVGNFVVKPGASFGLSYFPDDSRGIDLLPSIGMTWYPGLPVTGDFSFGWKRIFYSNDELLDNFPLALSLAIIPLPWLCVSGGYTALYSDSGISSYRIDAGIELTQYRSGGINLHLPLHYHYSWSEGTGGIFGLSVMLGFSLGSE